MATQAAIAPQRGKKMPPAHKGDMTHTEWTAKCLKPTYAVGEEGVPGYAIAVCRDGSYTASKQPKGRCSGHGGVGKSL